MESGVKAKKGYSLWSLLVIMTLLAVLLVIPKRPVQLSVVSFMHSSWAAIN